MATDSEEPFIGGGADQSEDEEDNIPIQNVPLEAKLQLKLEKRMKMKISKEVRLCRKYAQEHEEEEGQMATFKDEETKKCMTDLFKTLGH